MASSSRECAGSTSKKVVVVKSNDFFSLRQVSLREKKERLQELKRNLTSTNVSFLSNICDLSAPSTSHGSTYAPKYKNLPSSSNKIQLTPKRVYKRKVTIADDGSGKTKLVDFAELSKAVNTDNTIAEKKNEMLNVNEDLTEEKIMELIDKKYGAALEAQLNIPQATTVQDNVTVAKTHLENSDSVAELPCNVDEYKLREEQFLEQRSKEQSVNDEVKEAERHLESILILDSPEDGYKLFTRQELKRLPVKIFESPDKLIIKREITFSKGENDEEQPQNSNADLQNLKSGAESDDTKSDTVKIEAKVDNIAMKEVKENVGDEQQQNSNIDLQNLKSSAESCNTKTDTLKIEAKVENIAMKEANSEKKMWEFNPNDINLDILMSQTNSGLILKPSSEYEKCGKAVVIANEDAVILKEMDEFIEEINVGKQILSSEETPVALKEKKENCDHSYCLQNIKIGENSGIIETCKRDTANEEKPHEKIKQTSDSKSSNFCVDAAKFEDVVKYMIQQNDLLDQMKTEETDDTPILETMKSDILEKLVREAEIYIEQSPNNDTTDGIATQNEAKCDNNGVINDQTQRDFQTTSSDNVNINPSSSSDEIQIEIDNDNINRDEILTLLEKAKADQVGVTNNSGSNDNTDKKELKHFGCSLKERITVLKELYRELEKATESTIDRLDKTLTAEEVCRLYNNLNFIKGVVEKASAKDERKKLKYKVISIRRKSTDLPRNSPAINKSLTKKVYKDVTLPRPAKKVSNKLLHKTLLRMNKLLDVLERNKTSGKTKQSHSVLKPAKSNIEAKSEIDKSSSGIEKSKVAKSCEQLDLNKSLKIILEKSSNRNKIDTRSIAETTEDTAKVAQSHIKRERQQWSTGDGKDLQNEKIGTAEEKHSVRYALRSRKVTVATIENTEKLKNSNTVSLNKTENQKSDYVLNDNQPCVVPYNKKERVFEKSELDSQNKHLVVDLEEGNKAVEAIRYGLRRKTLEKTAESQRQSRRV